MTAPTPNTELAYRVLDTARAADKLNMGYWVSRSGGLVGLADLTGPSCGTTACLAGWTVVLAGYQLDWDGDIYQDGVRTGRHVQEFAAELLGISDVDADDLFYVGTGDLDDRFPEFFGPRPDGGEGGTGCRCDWLGEGTPEHAPSPLCRSLRPDADRDEMQPPPCADHSVSWLTCTVCTAQRRAFYAALGREDGGEGGNPTGEALTCECIAFDRNQDSPAGHCCCGHATDEHLGTLGACEATS